MKPEGDDRKLVLVWDVKYMASSIAGKPRKVVPKILAVAEKGRILDFWTSEKK